jgi:hypothetical protein
MSKNDGNICAPLKYDEKNHTCFSLEQLSEMAKAYNRYASKGKLSPNESRVDTGKSSLIEINNDKAYLLKEIMSRFKNICAGSEVCITQQHFMNEIVGEMREDIIYGTFRISGPNKSDEWLSTVDINGIMTQYEKVYPNFKFMGAVPRDCDSLNFCSLARSEFSKLESSGKEQIGIIFNQDAYGESGSHWVAMYLNLPKGECYYCDSLGKKPVSDVSDYIEKFRAWYKKKYGKEADYQWNKKSYQKDDSECGIYSCNFLIRKLGGESFDSITKNSLKFEDINSCRNKYFSNQPSKFVPHQRCEA